MNDVSLVGKTVDIPFGWKYGFPKPYNPREGEQLNEWLLRNGCPKEDIDFAMQHMRIFLTE
jgi:hypothetical protein